MISKYKFYILGAIVLIGGYFAYRHFYVKKEVDTNKKDGTDHLKSQVKSPEIAYTN